MKRVDYAIIWAGAWGLTVAIGLAKLGKNVLLIEKGEMWGDCTNVWCVPSKALISVANEAQKTGEIINLRDALKVARAKRQYYRDHETPEELKKRFGLNVLKGEAQFKSKRILTVGGKTIYVQKKIIIATGSRPFIPTIPGLAKKDILTNENIFELNENIKNLVIVWGGYIGCELGETLAKLGVNVTLIQRNTRLIPREEKEASELIQNLLKRQWVTVFTSTTIIEANNEILLIESDGTTKKIPYDKVLIATWRQANIASLQCENANIAYNNQGIIVDHYNRTTAKNIFAIGDCVAENPKFTHWADNEGQWVIRNILTPFYKVSVRHRPLPVVMYTSLEVARVGFSHAEIGQYYTDKEIVTKTHYFNNNDRSHLNNKTEWFITIHFTRVSWKIIGATIVAENSGEIIPQITYAIENEEKVNLEKFEKAWPRQTEEDKKLWEETI